jgi:hypothetical protein
MSLQRLFILLALFLLAMTNVGTSQETDERTMPRKDSLIYVYYPGCFNCVFFHELTMQAIDQQGIRIVASQRSYLGQELSNLLERGKIEGFDGATKHSSEFNANKIRAKIVFGNSVYYIDYDGKMRDVPSNPENPFLLAAWAIEGSRGFDLRNPHRTFALSKETFLEIAQLLHRYTDVADLQSLTRNGYKVIPPQQADADNKDGGPPDQ